MGSLCLGGTGSGKSTGVGATLANAFLERGFGGTVLTCKPTDAADWVEYCQRANRLDDLVIVDSSCQHRYSFLNEEVQREGGGAGLTANIVAIFETIIEIGDREGGNGGRDSEPYWRRATKQLTTNLVDLLLLAEEQITVPNLYRLAVSAPISLDQLHRESWQKSSYCFQCLQAADTKPKTSAKTQDFRLVADYFTNEYVNLSERTRSVILSTFTSMADILNRSLLRTLFSTDTTIRPEATFLEGKIIVINLPVKEFAQAGRFAQVLWKYCFQRAVERRNVTEHPRPVFLVSDEFQNFTVEFDSQFQTTARSSRVSTVLLTQNISTLLAAFGGESAQALTDSLAGNLQTKFFCANGEATTNEWASRMIGQKRQFFVNASQSGPQDWYSQLFGPQTNQQSAGVSQQLDYEVPPHTFTTLRSGGPHNDWTVDTIAFQGGRRFVSTGKTWLPVSFRQLVE